MSNIDYNYFVDNFKIDNIWREFVFKKFSSQIKINIEELSKQAQNQQKEILKQGNTSKLTAKGARQQGVGNTAASIPY